VEMDKLGGMQKKLPLVGSLFFLGAASIACLPPFNGFSGEFLLSLSLLNGIGLSDDGYRLTLLLCLVVFALIGGLALAAYTKAYGMTFLGEPRSQFAAAAHPAENKTLWPLLLPAAFCVIGGMASPFLFKTVADAAVTLGVMPVFLQREAALAVIEFTPPMKIYALTAALLLLMAAALLLLRSRVTRKSMPTWGCGYQYGTARIQYTDASFVQPLTELFDPISSVRAHKTMDSGFFPVPGHLEVNSPDVLLRKIFTPLFEAVEKGCNALKIMQHGKIHFYILYILTVLILLLIWGLYA